MNSGQIHRFRDSVAAYIGTGATVYMTPGEARAMARALNRAARSVEREPFARSAGVTTQLTFADWHRSGESMPEIARDETGRAVRRKRGAA
jgi:hypothetical protein